MGPCEWSPDRDSWPPLRLIAHNLKRVCTSLDQNRRTDSTWNDKDDLYEQRIHHEYVYIMDSTNGPLSQPRAQGLPRSYNIDGKSDLNNADCLLYKGAYVVLFFRRQMF